MKHLTLFKNRGCVVNLVQSTKLPRLSDKAWDEIMTTAVGPLITRIAPRIGESNEANS